MLGGRLQGLVVEELARWKDRLAALESGHLHLLEAGGGPPRDVAGTLAEVMQRAAAVRRLLAAMKRADDLEQALSMTWASHPARWR